MVSESQTQMVEGGGCKYYLFSQDDEHAKKEQLHTFPVDSKGGTSNEREVPEIVYRYFKNISR